MKKSFITSGPGFSTAISGEICNTLYGVDAFERNSSTVVLPSKHRTAQHRRYNVASTP